jgi:hypothetical protein
MAALALSMAVYARIVTEGFTLRRGALLSLTAVASVSCKEQAAPAFAAMYGWILLSALPLRRRFLFEYAAALLIGMGAYFAIDVVYAPASWWEHIQFWTSGPGKDAAVWAPPGYTRSQYLKDAMNNFLFNLGPGGSAAVLAAMIGGAFYRSRAIVGAWAPFVVYLIVVVATAGYMPRYFMLPVTVLAALPVALVFARWARAWLSLAHQPQLAAVLGLFLVTGLNLWEANMAWAQVRERPSWLIEHYAASNISKDQSVGLANPWRVAAGSSRLSYLGYRVDDRPLGALMQQSGGLPDFILITREWENWLRDFSKAPARNELYEGTGYSYAAFRGMRALGYELQETVQPQLPFFLTFRWFPWPPNRPEDTGDLLVYRKISGKL